MQDERGESEEGRGEGMREQESRETRMRNRADRYFFAGLTFVVFFVLFRWWLLWLKKTLSVSFACVLFFNYYYYNCACVTLFFSCCGG